MVKKREESAPDTPGRRARLAVGSRVITPHSRDSSRPEDEWPRVAGVIVDDFSETLVAHHEYGRDWAITRRWAVALDEGSLVFRDDEHVERES